MSTLANLNRLTDVEMALVKQIESRAVYLLSMREHGDLELQKKLEQKLPDIARQVAEIDSLDTLDASKLPCLVKMTLETCQKNHWQSDARYIEAFVRQAIEKGQGPYKIRQNLNGRTSHSDLVSAELDLDDDIWIEQAQVTLEKKYGDNRKPSQRNEQAKRMRFLQSRGFSPSHIYKAFR